MSAARQLRETPVAVFRCDPSMLLRGPAKYCGAASIVLFIVVALGQWRVGRFPERWDLYLALTIPWVVFVALAAVIYAIVRFAPVTLYPTGLRCSSYWGRYRTVSWPQVQSVDLASIGPLHYVLLEIAGLRTPLMLPLWVRDIERLEREVSASGAPARRAAADPTLILPPEAAVAPLMVA